MSVQALEKPPPFQTVDLGASSMVGTGQSQGSSKQAAAPAWAPKNMIVRGAFREVTNQM